MKTLINLLTIMMVFGLYGSKATANDAKEGMAKQQSHTAFSPRQYCRSSGGQVTETENHNIYLCCYEKKHKCIVSDTRQTVSWSIPYEGLERTPEKIKVQLLQLLDGTNAFPDSGNLAMLERNGQ